jgi:outer membrane protein assembly factor BamD
VTKSTDPEFKFAKANEYYEKGECLKAVPLYEELIPVYKGTKSIDDLYYKYADCHFQQGDYLLSSFHFKNIYDSYPLSEYAEECLYMYAYSYYMLSPDVNLDQTYTEKAMEAFQLFVNAYPDSKRMAECNNLMDNLRKKMESKAFRNAKLYLKTGKYRAAALAFSNMLKDYPDTQYSEEAAFLIVKAYYLYARYSITSKQKERYQEAMEAYKDFIYRYNGSKFAGEAEQLNQSAIDKIEKLKNPN